MSFDDNVKVKDDTRDGEIVTFAAPTMTELRRSAETIRPVPEKRGRQALAAAIRQRLDWTQLPGLRPRREDTSSPGTRPSGGSPRRRVRGRRSRPRWRPSGTHAGSSTGAAA